MRRPLVLSLLLQAGTIWVAPAAAQPTLRPAPQAEPQPDVVPVLFVFYRARYFHDAAALRGCARAEAERTRALDVRYDVLKRRVARQFGASAVVSDNDERPDRGTDPDCRSGVTVTGYENAVNELTRRMGGGGQ